MGLNDNYVVVICNILVTNPMPKIGQALSMVLQEERQRELHTSSSLLGDSSSLLFYSKSNFIPSKLYVTANTFIPTILSTTSTVPLTLLSAVLLTKQCLFH